MNRTPEKNIQIGNNIINLNEISAITYIEKNLSDGGPRIFFRFKSSSSDLQVSFNNQESFYTTKANLKKLIKPIDITIDIPDLPVDDYLTKNQTLKD